MSQGRHLKGKIEGGQEVMTHKQVLQILSEMTAKGSVSAAISLERALRPQAEAEDVDDALEQLLRSED